MKNTTAEANEKQRFRFSLRACLWFQLQIAPAFLSAVYYRIHDRNHPYVVFVAFLLAPTCYTGALSCRSAVSVVRHQAGLKRQFFCGATQW